jgi:hypothetical protein
MPEFTATWQDILCRTFGWKKQDYFCLVPDLFGIRPVASCLPLLDHSHYDPEEARELLASGKYHKGRVRTLTRDNDKRPEHGQPVLMRLELEGRTVEDISRESLHSVCRNRLRKSRQQNYDLKSGKNESLIADGYKVFLQIMQRHGTPAFPRRLFSHIVAAGLGEMSVVYREGKPVCMLFLVIADNIAWIPWCGAIETEKRGSPNHLTHWAAIETSVARGVKIFDFGRSDFGGGTYFFKAKWGARPVVVEMVSQSNVDPYRFRLAARIWKKLPMPLTKVVGPWLTRRLPDY